tara:strand:+ start:308 stop:511 length:204 start_codon:yes stop_codon:yes gene_type:complete
MNKLVEVLKKMALEMILNDEIKKSVISNLNKKVNLPMISEKTEAELMESMYDAMQEAIEGAVLKKEK